MWRRLGFLIATCLTTGAAWAQPLTWDQVRSRFEAANPTLRAGEIGVDESRAQEITANLRPNPEMVSTFDQINPFTGNPYRPLAYTLPFTSFSYLHERDHKRELRTESARQGTAIARSDLADQRRNLLFNLRGTFVQALQAKAVADVARENLAYYDRLLAMSRERFKAGDISRVDLDRLELQRVPFEADAQTSDTNVRTAKIQLLMLMNDRTPADQFDVSGTFDFSEPLTTIQELHEIAMAMRPDLLAAQQSIDRGKDGLPAGGGKRVRRSDVLHGFRAQPAHPGLHGLQHQFSAKDFRPQPGRKSAHGVGYQAHRTAARRRAIAGIQPMWIRPGRR